MQLSSLLPSCLTGPVSCLKSTCFSTDQVPTDKVLYASARKVLELLAKWTTGDIAEQGNAPAAATSAVIAESNLCC